MFKYGAVTSYTLRLLIFYNDDDVDFIIGECPAYKL